MKHVVDSILQENGINNKLIVAHTHRHGDHVAADNQFKTRPNTEVIGLSWEAVQRYFAFSETITISSMELGSRSITVLSIPGHDQTSLAFHDSETNLLLSGDTFYPDRLYVRDWPAFKKSVKLILSFANDHNTTQFISNHIEMTNKNGVDYPVGTTFQPDEHVQPMTISELKELDKSLDHFGDSPKLEVHDHFIVYPK